MVVTILVGCAGLDPDAATSNPTTTARSTPSSPSPVTVASTSAAPSTLALTLVTVAPPSSVEVVSTMPPPTTSPLVGSLPAVPGYSVTPWSDAENEAFFAGPFGPSDVSNYVAEFAGADVLLDDVTPIGWIELFQLLPELEDVPDAVVLDIVADISYGPGRQTTERVTVGGEQVLVRRIPTLTAWTWLEDSVLVNVVADQLDPGVTGLFVAALATAQQAATAPAPTSVP